MGLKFLRGFLQHIQPYTMNHGTGAVTQRSVQDTTWVTVARALPIPSDLPSHTLAPRSPRTPTHLEHTALVCDQRLVPKEVGERPSTERDIPHKSQI